MLSKNRIIQEKLKNLVLFEEREEQKRNFEWINNYKDVKFWSFLSINYLELDRFFTLLDIETGPQRGWEKFVESIGLTLWEDRKWCQQYHDGGGPTRAAFAKLLGKQKYDKDLTLAFILETLKEMERFDILLQIDWDNLVKKYHKFGKSSLQSSDNEKTLVFQLNRTLESSQLLKAEPVNDICSKNYITVNKLKDNIKKNKISNSLDICILMLYASDAEEYAKEVAEQLRVQSLGGRKKLKILMLGDSNIKRVLAPDCNNILHKWFNQVKYIVPVLSPLFLKEIQNIEETTENALYNRYIYRLTLDQFVSLGSRNIRCRPICPSLYMSQVKNSSVVKGNGLFTIIWNCSSSEEIEEFSLVLMDTNLMA